MVYGFTVRHSDYHKIYHICLTQDATRRTQNSEKVLDPASERWKYHMMNNDELYGVKFPTMKPLGD